jgi:hypothetical protein
MKAGAIQTAGDQITPGIQADLIECPVIRPRATLNKICAGQLDYV